jgi:probable phosphoglycerate mutase
MTTILLTRHGQNEYVKQGRLAGRLPRVHLNQQGREQAKKLGEVLATIPIKAIYSSPLERAVETAEPIAAKHDLSVIKREGLLEMDIGKWQGKTIKQVARTKLWKVVQYNPTLARFPEGESFGEAQLRIAGELETLTSMHKPTDIIVCVGHSDMIKLAVAYYLGLSLDFFQRLTVAPASITTLNIGKSGTRLVNLNCSPTSKGNA